MFFTHFLMMGSFFLMLLVAFAVAGVLIGLQRGLSCRWMLGVIALSVLGLWSLLFSLAAIAVACLAPVDKKRAGGSECCACSCSRKSDDECACKCKAGECADKCAEECADKCAVKAAAKPASQDRYDEIERLFRLKETGALTEAEFTHEKRRILGIPADETAPAAECPKDAACAAPSVAEELAERK